MPARLLAPDFPEARVAAAARAIRVVPLRVLLVEVLVILLGRPEPGRRDDLRHHRLAELLLDRTLRLLGRFLLRLVGDEDRRAILIPAIAELPARRERIDVVP